MAETDEFKKLQRTFAEDVFGLSYCPNIQVIPEGISGEYEIKDDIDIENNYIFQTLLHAGDVVMDNNPSNSAGAHRYFLKHARGRILVSGLGLGTSLHEVLKNPKVEFVRVIEREPSIIKLVAPAFAQHGERVDIIQGDAFKYKPAERYDCIFHALWSTEAAAREDIKTRQKLKKRYAKYCDWQGFAFLSNRGGERKAAGRPEGTTGPTKPDHKKRTVRKGVRYLPAEYELIRQAAKKAGVSESQLMQNGATKEALRIVYGVEDGRQLDALLKRMYE